MKNKSLLPPAFAHKPIQRYRDFKHDEYNCTKCRHFLIKILNVFHHTGDTRSGVCVATSIEYS